VRLLTISMLAPPLPRRARGTSDSMWQQRPLSVIRPDGFEIGNPMSLHRALRAVLALVRARV